jgi:hypothetical protein
MNRVRSTRPIRAVIAVMLFTCASGGVSLASHRCQTCEVTIHLDKDVYLVDEPIWLDVFVVNAGDEQVTVPPPSHGAGFRLILINAEGDTLPYEGPIPLYVRMPIDTLSPGDSLYQCENLLHAFGDRLPWLSAALTIEPGAYRVSGHYAGDTRSNVLTFSVIEPDGEERQARKLLRDGLRHMFSRQEDQGIRELERFMEQYPNSVYAPRACLRLAGGYGGGETNREKYEAIVRRLLVQYPNSGFVRFALGHYADRRDEEVLALIDSVKSVSNSLRFRMLAKRSGF